MGGMGGMPGMNMGGGRNRGPQQVHVQECHQS
jgi:hypothetical protein